MQDANQSPRTANSDSRRRIQAELESELDAIERRGNQFTNLSLRVFYDRGRIDRWTFNPERTVKADAAKHVG